MKLLSPAFKEGGMIPQDYACDKEDISPPLNWSDVPPHTESFALIMEDPDASSGNFVHWILYNLPATATALDKGLPQDKPPAPGAKQGINSFKKIGYGGPCPPTGTHRYFFKLYALDDVLRLHDQATKEELLSVMRGHVLAESELMGKYARLAKVPHEKKLDEASEESFPASDAPSWNP